MSNLVSFLLMSVFVSGMASLDYQVRDYSTTALIYLNNKYDLREYINISHIDPEVSMRLDIINSHYYNVRPTLPCLDGMPEITAYNGLNDKDWLDYFHSSYYPTVDMEAGIDLIISVPSKWTRNNEYSAKRGTVLFVQKLWQRGMTRNQIIDILNQMVLTEQRGIVYAPRSPYLSIFK